METGPRAAWSAAVLALCYAGAFAAARVPTGEARQAEAARRAAALVAEKKYADALAPVLTLSQAFPDNHVYAEQLATVYHGLGKPAEEAKAWEQFVRSSPTPYEACPQIIDAYRRQGALDRAIDASARCLTFSPNDADMMFFAGRGAEWQGDLARAEELYHQAAQADARNTDVVLGLARVHLRRGDTVAAVESAQAVLARDPDDTDALFIAGSALERDGRLAEARTLLERAVTLRETNVDLHVALGMVEQADGHPAEARRHYTRALALDPGRTDARDRLRQLEEPPG